MLEALRTGGFLNFVQGVEFTEELLAEVLAAAPTEDDQRIFRNADLRGASFEGATGFRGARFQGAANFGGAEFQGDAEFVHASFEGVATFDGARFQTAWFLSARLRGDARFEGADFQGDAGFSWANFQGDVRFSGARFQSNARFDEASFERPVDLGSVRVSGILSLDKIMFVEPVHLEATAAELSCRRTRFRAGGQLRVTEAEITLEDADIPAPLIIARHAVNEEVFRFDAISSSQPTSPPAQKRPQPPPALPAYHPTSSPFPKSRRWEAISSNQPTGPPAPERPRPQVVSVQRADVAKLTLTDLDLRSCLFTGAHHLDQLTINSAEAFHRAPARVGHGRQVLAEECAWRRKRPREARRGWPFIPTAVATDQPPADPGQLVGVYRQLRKGREDAKNEPGAADFYYGECEMRRHAADTPWAERAILTAYWLLSGYGLRAVRALLTLLAVVVITVGLLVLYGLPQQRAARAEGSLQGRLAGGQTITVELGPADSTSVPTSSIADRWSWQRFEKASRTALNAVVFRSAEQQLTPPGRYIEMTARFLGPVLLTLAILAVRNRVKR